MDTSATIGKDIIFFSSFDELEKRDDAQLFWQNTEALSEFHFATGTTIESIIPSFGVREKSRFSEFSTQNTSASRELNFNQDIESGVTQDFTNIQPQIPAFPFYNEEDILNLDAAIDTPPPRLSRTIRVKLIYEEPSEPIPVEDPWE